MYQMNICKCKGCMRPSISDTSKGIVESSGWCYKHHPERDRMCAEIKKYINQNEKIVGLNASGMSFSDIDFSGKKIYGGNFRHCFFMNCRNTNLRSKLCTFDYSMFTDCVFTDSVYINNSFAGVKFIHVIFTGSELIQVNFTGSQSFQSSFDDSNLYQSRFIKVNFVDTSFRNCNVKRTMFYEINQTNTFFRMANTKEAMFDKHTSEMFLGEESTKGIVF